MSDDATRRGLERQLKDLLHFQNTLIEAAEMPDDIMPNQVLPWFIERLKMADVGDYETAMGEARVKDALSPQSPPKRFDNGTGET